MTNLAHNSTINSANSVFSTTKHLSESEKKALFEKYTSKRIPSEPGNTVPHFWYKIIVDEKGRPELTSIALMSEIFALYRFSELLCPSFYKNLHEMPVVIDQSLRVSYEHFAKKFYFPDEKIRRGLIRLEELGFIKRGVINIAIGNGRRCNKLIITLDEDFFLSCFRDPDKDIRACRKGESLSGHGKKSKPDVEDNSKENNFQSPQISQDLISNNNYLKDRSMNGSNFLKNSEEGNPKINSNDPKATKIVIEPESTAQDQSNTKARLLEQTRKYKTLKKLGDFHPLTQEDVIQFQIKSGREFDLNAMNEILLSMSRKDLDASFYHRNGFINYMTKVYKHEMRDAVKISNGTFRIKSNMTEDEKRENEVEKYLAEVENSTQVSPEWHLKKKLACVLEKDKAYALLKAYGSIAVVGGIAKLHMHDAIELTPSEHEIVLSQIKATHERYEGGEYVMVEKLEFVVAKSKGKALKADTSVEIPDTVWGKIRRGLVDIYGHDTDGNWFAKLDAKVDEVKKTIDLKAPSLFYKDWIKSHYEHAIERIAIAMGVSIKIIV